VSRASLSVRCLFSFWGQGSWEKSKEVVKRGKKKKSKEKETKRERERLGSSCIGLMSFNRASGVNT